MEHASSSSTQIGITVLRVSLGIMWTAHALLKLFVFTLPGTVQYFVSIGIPGFLAYPVFAAELLGGHRTAAERLCASGGAGFGAGDGRGCLGAPAQRLGSYQRRRWLGIPGFLIGESMALWLIGDGAAAIKRNRLLIHGRVLPVLVSDK